MHNVYKIYTRLCRYYLSESTYLTLIPIALLLNITIMQNSENNLVYSGLSATIYCCSKVAPNRNSVGAFVL